jgi:hypothetical protein
MTDTTIDRKLFAERQEQLRAAAGCIVVPGVSSTDLLFRERRKERARRQKMMAMLEHAREGMPGKACLRKMRRRGFRL